MSRYDHVGCRMLRFLGPISLALLTVATACTTAEAMYDCVASAYGTEACQCQ